MTARGGEFLWTKPLACGSAGTGLDTKLGLGNTLVGPENDFLRPKIRAKRPVGASEAGRDTAAATGATGATGAEAMVAMMLDVALGSGGGVGPVACGRAFWVSEMVESLEAVRRRKLALRNMAVPITDLSRCVLLVRVEEEAGGKGDRNFWPLLLEGVVEEGSADVGKF